MSRAGILLLQRVNQHEFDPEPSKDFHTSLNSLQTKAEINDRYVQTAIELFGLESFPHRVNLVREVVIACNYNLREATVRLDHIIEWLRSDGADLADINQLIDEFVILSEKYTEVRNMLVARLDQVRERLPDPWRQQFVKSETHTITDLTLINLGKSIWPREKVDVGT